MVVEEVYGLFNVMVEMALGWGEMWEGLIYCRGKEHGVKRDANRL